MIKRILAPIGKIWRTVRKRRTVFLTVVSIEEPTIDKTKYKEAHNSKDGL